MGELISKGAHEMKCGMKKALQNPGGGGRVLPYKRLMGMSL